jgi:hypothetical protein
MGGGDGHSHGCRDLRIDAGHRPRLRFSWDASVPGVITWRNEMAAPDGSWFLIEEYTMVPRQP